MRLLLVRSKVIFAKQNILPKAFGIINATSLVRSKVIFAKQNILPKRLAL